MQEGIENIDSSYYDEKYFAVKDGKRYRNVDGSEAAWSYANPDGEWFGCNPIVSAWKEIFGLVCLDCSSGSSSGSSSRSSSSSSKVLDVGCGRGTFIGYLRGSGIETFGFDFSKWAIEHPYTGKYKCDPGWIMLHDATKQFPYGGCPFDLVIALDIMEHMYLEDIDKVIDEIYRVSKKWVFLQIATVGGGSGSALHDKGYILKRGDVVPIELEGMVIAGHVTVQNRQFWVDKLMKDGSGNVRNWRLRDDMALDFIRIVPIDVIANWIKNTILILERL